MLQKNSGGIIIDPENEHASSVNSSMSKVIDTNSKLIKH